MSIPSMAPSEPVAQNRVLDQDVVIPSNMFWLVMGPLETNGHILDIEGGLVGVI